MRERRGLRRAARIAASNRAAYLDGMSDASSTSDFRSGAASRPVHVRSRPLHAAIASARSSADASTWLSVPCGVHATAWTSAARRTSWSALVISGSDVFSMTRNSSSRAPGLRAGSSVSMFWSSAHASSMSQPLPRTAMITIGICFFTASHSSRRHHGRVSSSRVARSTRTSDFCTPSVKSTRRSVSSDESRYTGVQNIRWSRSRR